MICISVFGKNCLKKVKVKQPNFTSITGDSNSTDNLAVDGALILPPLSHKCFILSLKLVKATQKGEKLKQGCSVTRNRTRDFAHRRQLNDPWSVDGSRLP